VKKRLDQSEKTLARVRLMDVSLQPASEKRPAEEGFLNKADALKDSSNHQG